MSDDNKSRSAAMRERFDPHVPRVVEETPQVRIRKGRITKKLLREFPSLLKPVYVPVEEILKKRRRQKRMPASVPTQTLEKT